MSWHTHRLVKPKLKGKQSIYVASKKKKQIKSLPGFNSSAKNHVNGKEEQMAK